jgi:hypothetical protein
MASASPPPIPDPERPFLLSLATMEWLIDQGRLQPSPASPFGFLLAAPRQTTPEERAAAAKRELGRAPSLALLQALDIGSVPEARIRVTTQAPSQPSQQLTFLSRSSSVAQAGFNTEGFLFGVPMKIGALESALLERLRSTPPDEGTTDRLVTPGALGLLTALWPREGRDSATDLPVRDALSTCQRLGADEIAARSWVDALVESTLVVQNDAVLSVAEDWQPWLGRLWSEERFELEVTPLPEGELDAACLLRRRERLLFVGPKGKRIVTRMIDETSLEDVPLGVPRSAGQVGTVMALSHLNDRLLAEAVGALLALTDEGLPDSANYAPTDAASRPPDQVR